MASKQGGAIRFRVAAFGILGVVVLASACDRVRATRRPPTPAPPSTERPAVDWDRVGTERPESLAREREHEEPALAPDPAPLAVPTDPRIARIEAWGGRFCPHDATGWPRPEDSTPVAAIDDVPPSAEDDPENRVDVSNLVEVGTDDALAVVMTRCHREISGAYNYVSSIVRVSGERVEVVRFAPLPRWARSIYEHSVDPNEVWRARLEAREGRAFLTSGILDRGLGDAGQDVEFRLEGGEFVAFRAHAWGIDHELTDGVWTRMPIVAPPARRCRPILEVSADGQGTLRAVAGLEESRAKFPVRERECRVLSDERIGCGPRDADGRAEVEYRVLPFDEDWLVHRYDEDGQNSLSIRTPRSCSLD